MDHGDALPIRRPRRSTPVGALVLAGIGFGSAGLAIAAAFGAFSPSAWPSWLSGGEGAQTEPRKVAAGRGALPSPDALPPASDPAALENVSPEQAAVANAEIPFSTRPNLPAAPFTGDPVGSDDWRRSVSCLAAAAYYEAAGEGFNGMRAVAQVVLNRVRHRSFPKTVCGVVFQGAERRTGCQFTFSCDGSLARKPSERGWADARAVAITALAGVVYPAVGLATHYHTRFVLPYWAPTLDKNAMIGSHIFYRWPGQLGTPGAFGGIYARAEPPLPWMTVLPSEIGMPTTAIDPALVLAPTGAPVTVPLEARRVIGAPATGLAPPPPPASMSAGAGARWVIGAPQAAAPPEPAAPANASAPAPAQR